MSNTSLVHPSQSQLSNPLRNLPRLSLAFKPTSSAHSCPGPSPSSEPRLLLCPASTNRAALHCRWLPLLACLLLGRGASVWAGETWGVVSICPFHCVCRNLSESLSTLCADKGLLFVPPNIDRRTVELRLADNFIRQVGGDDFANMTGLVDLTLSRNTIDSVRPLAFGDLESLRSLHLDGNRLLAVGPRDLGGLVNLQHLILNNNQLCNISVEAFDDFLPTLEDLDLSYNNLRQVPWEAVQSMASLHTLNLDHNLIHNIAEGTFAELYKLARLDMTSNRLQTLPPDPLFARSQTGVLSPTPYTPIISLNFGGNPLHCNCELLWLRRLVREDDMETCATPVHLAGRYFWSIPEEEFACEPPLITRHTHKLWVLEGQRAALRCRAIGDPEPLVHWVSPDDRIVANSSRSVSYRNGTLDMLVTQARDDGTYTCIAINAAGEATALVDLKIIPLPHRGNGTVPLLNARDPGSSDITTGKTGGGAAAGGGGTSAGGTGSNGEAPGDGPAADGQQDQTGPGESTVVGVLGVTSSSARVRWDRDPAKGVWMYQIQYNCSVDETLIYRIVPSTSRSFLLKNLVPGVEYNLCVLSIFDDTLTSLAATRVLGCAQFSTKDDYPECRSLQAHFLGGTLTILVGGVVVVMLLVFTVTMMVRHRVCGDGDDGGCHGNGDEAITSSPSSAKGTSVYSQTNGSGGVMMVVMPNGLLPQQQERKTPTPKVKPRTLPKPKFIPEELQRGGAVGGDTNWAVAIPEKQLIPYPADTQKVSLYYSPSSLPRPTAGRLRLAELDRRAGHKIPPPRRGEDEEVAEAGGSGSWRSSHAYQSPPPRSPAPSPRSLAIRAKRRSSLDMGEIATTTCYSYAKRLSVMWTRRSQSLHGMLVQCGSATSASSSSSSGGDGQAPRPRYLHAYNTTNSNSNAGSAAGGQEELEESVV